MSVYQLKSRFQNILRPLVRSLAARGVTANQVTSVAAAVSVLLGLFLSVAPIPHWFLLVPAWFLLRMALNAIDGMLAREHGQKSILGAYLNEIGDVVSDVALYLPFALIDPNGLMLAISVIFLSALTEFAGVLGQTVGASRRYDGPLGKSDRAVLFAALGIYVAVGGEFAGWTSWLWAVVALLLVWTIINRIRAGIREANTVAP
ncbi:CDP-alcohol phosphatidyltransferase family protein [Rhizobium lentis]|uniref:CDP-alcohol phosphatidyltransferase family protein n=1 Tax=Rhizobium lentis TaxID=1138194 RepID=A0ABS7IN24_9HYPH|nr:CDP-alcohol phosphatidyltransferase family protein [Rhizobium lentis]MBX4955359.1 CDP-alcohol phosphatidyltransferase family protein [Rhizobium lentis]MBX4973361.1 CDP-alcohol phosphatidyltransferase family protein [Rhizobium lentis]MBX4984666.1 CDP-alcohol phosphatidyltransferase family protein [Rhizobium lentis]MBX5003111.1 CDP-alcohol phosphatidyltransferase family protein [Rhizobium lentis]MBX5029147.1 CDP-alcohol phosphatidyltransferase family protein [Rhizobium lentis]